MDILSPKTLALVRDPNVSRAVDELLEHRELSARLVVTVNGKHVRVRRVWARDDD